MFDDFEHRQSEKDPVVEVRYLDLIDETESAWHLLFDMGQTKFLPKSKCELDPDSKIILVPEWLAIKEGLENG